MKNRADKAIYDSIFNMTIYELRGTILEMAGIPVREVLGSETSLQLTALRFYGRDTPPW